MAEADILKLTNMNRVLSDRELFRIVHTKKKKKRYAYLLTRVILRITMKHTNNG